jgi:hypothetical protein
MHCRKLNDRSTNIDDSRLALGILSVTYLMRDSQACNDLEQRLTQSYTMMCIVQLRKS